jgi:FSR family fosmidomycin resistance protein-like MFS transporter
VVLSSAAGTLGCGTLADRFGRRAVIIGALIVTIPAVLLFARFPGPLGFLSGALVGLSAASTGPLTLVMAQQLMSRRAGMASGLILGLGFVTGAIGVPVTGMLADMYGMQRAIEAQVLLVVATIGLALLLPSEQRLARLAPAETKS